MIVCEATRRLLSEMITLGEKKVSLNAEISVIGGGCRYNNCLASHLRSGFRLVSSR